MDHSTFSCLGNDEHWFVQYCLFGPDRGHMAVMTATPSYGTQYYRSHAQHTAQLLGHRRYGLQVKTEARKENKNKQKIGWEQPGKSQK